MFGAGVQRVLAVGRLGDDLHATLFGEQPTQALARQRFVIGDHYPHRRVHPQAGRAVQGEDSPGRGRLTNGRDAQPAKRRDSQSPRSRISSAQTWWAIG